MEAPSRKLAVTYSSAQWGTLMPFQFNGFDASPLCTGYEWVIRDEQRLAELVAQLVVGECEHVRRVLAGTLTTPVGVHREDIDVAVDLLQDIPNEKRRYHRDGWLFQLISWIALRQTDPDSLAAVPHPRPADKGFDNLIVRLDEDGRPVSLLIGEDKASQDPRNIVTSQVWPEIRDIENRQRESEIKTALTAVISVGPYDREDVAGLIRNVFWSSRREYRVAVAGPETPIGRLYAGYHDVAPGTVERRRGETLALAGIRDWFDSLVAKVVAVLQGMETRDV